MRGRTGAGAWARSGSLHDITSETTLLRRPCPACDFPWPIQCTTAPFYRYPDIALRMKANRFAPTAAE